MFPSHVTGRLVAGAVAAVVAVAAWAGGLLTPLEDASVDARFSLRDTPPVTDIVVVGIDDPSISRLRGWPFRRLRHAEVVDRLREAGVRAIVLDVQFTEPSSRPEDDLALYDAIGRAGGATLATSTSAADGSTNVLGGDANLAQIDSRAAAANFSASRGDVIRRYPARVRRLPSIAVVAAERVTGRRLSPSAFDDGAAWIDFRGGPGTIPTVSFEDVRTGRVPRAALRGKVVVVGATAPTLQDRHATTTSGEETMSGPEVQANAIWTAMRGNPLRDAPAWLAVVSMTLLGIALPVAGLRVRPLLTLPLATVIGIGVLAGAQVAFQHGLVVAVAGPMVALAGGTLGTFAAGYVLETRRRRRAAAYGRALEREVAARTSELRTTQLEILQRLSLAAEHRDNETGAHLRRMSRLCGELARAADVTDAEAEEIEQASLLHDVGKIGLSDHILHKPGRLTPEERAEMQRHTTIGADMLGGSSSSLLRTAEAIARTHHERWDGGGYPAGLRGEDIPFAGRVAAICDVYDALLSPRPYKPAWTIDAVMAHLESERGRHFDPLLLDAFLELRRAEHPRSPGADLPRAA